MSNHIYPNISIFRANGPEAARYRRMTGNKPIPATIAMLEAAHGWLAPGAVSSICGWPGVYKHTRSVLLEVPGDAGQTQNA
jgi:hypothetical protein